LHIIFQQISSILSLRKEQAAANSELGSQSSPAILTDFQGNANCEDKLRVVLFSNGF
jgi:hypothetical protein